MATEERVVGRPTVMTPEIISKLEEVFAIGGTDSEACFYAGIGQSTLYSYQESHPEFVERKDALKEKPILKARQTVVQSLNDPNHAFRFLSKKRRKEFGDSLDLTTDGEKIQTVGDPLLAKQFDDWRKEQLRGDTK